MARLLLLIASLLLTITPGKVVKREDTSKIDRTWIRMHAETASKLEKAALVAEIDSQTAKCQAMEAKYQKKRDNATSEKEEKALKQMWLPYHAPKYHDCVDALIVYMYIAITHFKDLTFKIDDSLHSAEFDGRGADWHSEYRGIVKKFIIREMKETLDYRRMKGDL
jgi:hypothetical protein